MEHQISCIYKISCSNGKYYIGSTIDFRKRKNRHTRDLQNNKHHNSHLQNIYNKYGKDSVSFEILEKFPKNDLFEAETKYILLNIDNTECVNILASSTCGDTLSNNPNKIDIISKRSKSFRKMFDKLTPDERSEMYGRFGEQNGSHGRKRSENEIEISRKYGKIGSKIRGDQTRGKTFGELYGEEESKIIKEKLSKTLKEKYKNPEDNPFFGKKHSDKHKETQRKNKIGTFNKHQSKPTSIDGVIYLSTRHANKVLDVSTATIIFRIKSKNFDNYFYIDASKTEDIFNNYKIYDTTNIYK